MTERNGNTGPVNQEAFDRTRDFILAAAESGREPTADWRDALHDVALELDKLAYAKLAHPDSVDSAALAMSSLSGVWLDDDERGALYSGALTADGPPAAPNGLQLDLLTVVARLKQIRDAGGWDADPLIADRVLNCDLPRLERHLTEETKRWAEEGTTSE